jgi:hypothetical protein
MTHVLNCRKGHCNEISKLITILLKYSLSFTFLFHDFTVTSYCVQHRPASVLLTTDYLVCWLHMLPSFFVLTSSANILTRKTFELHDPPIPSPLSFKTGSCLDKYALWTLPPLQLIVLGNSWRDQFKCGLHEMCWNSRRSWNYALYSVRHGIN